MANFSTAYYSGTPKHRGAVLIVSLMMLLIMTILGINAVLTTTLQERMTGNLRNKHMSFQATEAALRTGERMALTLTRAQIFDDGGTDGMYTRQNFTVRELLDITSSDELSWQDGSDGSAQLAPPTLFKEPQYIVENYGESPRNKSCMRNAAKQSCGNPSCCLARVYRITARGFGINNIGGTVLQSTVREQ